MWNLNLHAADNMSEEGAHLKADRFLRWREGDARHLPCGARFGHVRRFTGAAGCSQPPCNSTDLTGEERQVASFPFQQDYHRFLVAAALRSASPDGTRNEQCHSQYGGRYHQKQAHQGFSGHTRSAITSLAKVCSSCEWNDALVSR